MNYQYQLDELTRRIVDRLCAITDRPEGWLPHTVYVEEEGEDHQNQGAPVYNHYKLIDFQPSGSCTLQNPQTKEVQERHLSEINMEWLITVLRWYDEIVCTQCKELDIRIREHKLDSALRRLLDVSLLEIPCFEQSVTVEICEDALNIPHEKPKKSYVLLYSMEIFERNVSDEKLLEKWQNELFGDEIERMTPDEFAERINDEAFNDQEYWVRFIEM